jgi:uncharacterized surface anchored protein
MKIRNILRTVLAVVLVTAQFVAAVPFLGLAADSPFQSSPFVTNISITDLTTGKDLGVSGNIAGKNDQVQIKFDFAVPDNVTVDEGTVYSFELPVEIFIPSAGISEKLTMTDKSGKKVEVADVFIAQDGKGTITFKNEINNYRGVSGSFYVSSKFNGDKIKNTTPVPISFKVEGKADPTTISVYFNQPDAAIAKSNGTYNSGTDSVSWTVTLNSNKTTVRNGRFLDTLPAGLTYKSGTFTVKDSSGTVVFKDGTAANKGTFSSAKNPMEYDFSQSFSEEYTVTYETTVSKEYYGQTLTNKATLDQDGKDVSAQGTIKYSPTYITKTADTVTAGDTGVNWTITIGRDGETLNSAVVSDNLSRLGALDTASGVVLDKGTASQRALTTSSTDAVYYTYDSAKNTLTVSAAAITGKHTISFATNLASDYWEKNESGEWNAATLTASDTPQLKNGVRANTGVVPGTQNSIITKGGAGYDASSHEITWTLDINKSARTLKNPTVTDAVPTAAGNAQQYVAGSFTVTKASDNSVVYKDGGTGNTGTFASASGTLSYNFGADISEEYKVTYKTAITDPAVYAGNASASYHNSASLITGDNITSVTPDASQNVSSTVISKTGSYDYKNREITWTVKANSDKTTLTDAVVTDLLTGSGIDSFTFEPSAITLDGAAMTAAANEAGLSAGKYYYDTATKKLTVSLGTITTEKTIVFKMIVTDPNTFFSTTGQKSIGNTVTLTDKENGPVNANASLTIDNGLVTKTGSYTANSDHIDWIVHINQNGVNLSDLKLRDNLAEGLVLDTSSIRLYKETLASNGSLSPNGDTAEAIDAAAAKAGVAKSALTSSNISYDASTNEFDFTVPYESGAGTAADPYVINSPYVLIFRTYVDAEHNGKTFSNTISFVGTATTVSSTSSPVDVWYATSGSQATGTTGTLNVTKTDSASGSALSGAVFGIYDESNNLIQQGTTDANGKFAFSFLQYAVPYSIKEIKAPANYTLNTTVHKFELKKGDNAGLYELNPTDNEYSVLVNTTATYTYSDVIKTGNISFTKVGGDGKGIAGATFTLYDSTGAKPVLSGTAPVTAVSGKDGIVTFTSVPYGSYKIKETSAPTDYAVSDTVLTAELTDANDGVVSGTLTLNDKVLEEMKTAEISLRKLGAGSAPLSGAVFTLYDAGGKNPVLSGGKPLTATSDENGLISFKGIVYGDYTLVETTAPADYAAVSPVKVSLHDGAAAIADGMYSVGDVTDAKLLGSITFTKTGDDGKPLAGAEFTLTDASGKTVGTPQTSDSKGIVTFADVPYGDGYTITETKAPADYVLLGDPITGISIHSQLVTLKSVANSKDAGVISFTKTDENGKPLAGAVFALFNSQGVKVGSDKTSDKNGKVTFSGVPFADGYTIKEISAPENYTACADITVNLHSQAYDIGRVADALRRGSIKVAKTNILGKPLAGAEFSLYSSDGTFIAKAVTGSDGTAVFTDITFGDYYTVETGAPAGYLRTDEKFAVQLNAANPNGWTNVADLSDKLIPTGSLSFPHTGSRETKSALAFAGMALISCLVIAADEIGRQKHRKKNSD